jgi:dATP pyrophosphohydrolase
MPGFVSNTVQVHVAAYLPETEEIRYLLLKRSKDKIPYPNIWQVITGTIEDDETAIECAMREFLEETGLTALKIWTLPYITSFFNPTKDHIHMSPCFGVLANMNQVVKLSPEHQEYQWLSYDECIERLVLPSHREATKIFRDYALNGEISDFIEYKS